MKQGNNIILLQLFQPITDQSKFLTPCRCRVEHGTPMGTCGFGSLFGTSEIFPETLQETVLLESKLALPVNPFVLERRKRCRDDVVCTTRVKKGANLCFRDEGNPLYLFESGKFDQPACLYGIATHYESRFNLKTDALNKCDGGSFFASVTHFYSWISTITTQIQMPVKAGCTIC